MCTHKEIEVANISEILEDALSSGELYFGSQAARSYFISICPSSLKQNGLLFQEDGRPNLGYIKTGTLSENELEDFKMWIRSYIIHCSSIILNFKVRVSQDVLDFCSIVQNEMSLPQK